MSAAPLQETAGGQGYEVPATVPAGLFRQVLGQYPTGVCVVTAIHPDGEAVGMTIGSFTSVSLDPPLVGFMPERTSSSWATAAGVRNPVLRQYPQRRPGGDRPDHRGQEAEQIRRAELAAFARRAARADRFLRLHRLRAGRRLPGRAITTS